MRVMPGGALESDSIFVGQKLDEHRGAFVLEYPMDRGAVVPSGWDGMERLWDYAYSKSCLNAKQEEHPLLITEVPLNPRKNRETMAEILFESKYTPALYFTPPSILSLYASGRTTGVVIDVGEGVTHAVPVYEGFALPHSITRSDVAGRQVTQQLQLQLRKAGLTTTTTAEHDLVRSMKEELCFLTPQPTADETILKQSKTDYQLPDGNIIQLDQERYTSANVLFDPSLIGSEEPGVADVLVNAIAKSDLELRQKLFSQIVMAGGSTLLPGFGDRLLNEVRSRSSARLRISAPPDRQHSAYVGGSILASLATFRNMWVSKTDYEEHGARILHRRNF